MSKIDRAVMNSGNYAFFMKYKPGFPIEFFGKTNPFSDKRKTLLSEILHPDDYMPFCSIVNEVINGKGGSIKTHARLKMDGEYRWFFMSAGAEHPSKGATDFCGMMFDVTEYLECESEDAVMHKFRTKIKESISSNDEPDLRDILGEDYLELIQQPFSHIKGLYSAIVANDGSIIASAYQQDKKINLNKMSYQRKKSIRVKHRTCASWIIAGESLEDINESAPLLEIMVQTVSEIANSYVVIGEEMENSQNANKLLGENFEDQILINNVYSHTLKCANTPAAFSNIIPIINDYFGLDKMLFAADDCEPVKVYHWDDAGNLIPVISQQVKDEHLNELLDVNAVVCASEDELRGEPSKNRSCAISRVYENGVAKGMIIFISNRTDRVWSNRDRKMLRSLTSILATLIYRSLMENRLALSQEHLERLAYTDHSTGIPNESAFERDMKAKIDKGEPCAIVSIEIANYKSMSESFSYHYADEVIKSVAEYISALPVHSRKKIYRYSNDILMVTLDGSDKGETTGLARAILSKFRAPWFLSETEYKIEMFAGIAFYPDDVYSFADCVKAATRTLRLAKERKTQTPVTYSVDLEEKLDENLRVRRLIIDAAENDFKGFYFLYTPIINAHTGELASCDGNLFWANNDIIVSKERFAPILERLGYGDKVYEYAMKRLCEFCATVRESGLENFKIGFDISESTLSSDFSVLSLKQALLDYSLPPDTVNVITSESAGTLAKSNVNLKQLAALGVNIVADDKQGIFLTDAVLENPYIKVIKLNMHRLCGDEVSTSYVRSFIEKAHEKGIKICIKGIDNQQLLDIANNFGIDYIQGIVNGRPLHTREFMGKLVLKQTAAK